MQLYMISLVTYACLRPHIPMNVLFPKWLRIKGSVSRNAIALCWSWLGTDLSKYKFLLKKNSLKNDQIQARTLAVRQCCLWFPGHQRSPWSPSPWWLQFARLIQSATNEGCKQLVIQKTHLCWIVSFKENYFSKSGFHESSLMKQTIFSNKGKGNQVGLEYNFHP